MKKWFIVLILVVFGVSKIHKKALDDLSDLTIIGSRVISFPILLKEASNEPHIEDWKSLFDILKVQKSYNKYINAPFIPMKHDEWKSIKEICKRLKFFEVDGLEDWGNNKLKTNPVVHIYKEFKMAINAFSRQIFYIKNNEKSTDLSACLQTIWKTSLIIDKINPSIMGKTMSRSNFETLLTFGHNLHLQGNLVENEKLVINNAIHSYIEQQTTIPLVLKAERNLFDNVLNKKFNQHPIYFTIFQLYDGNALKAYDKFMKRSDLYDKNIEINFKSLPVWTQIMLPSMYNFKMKFDKVISLAKVLKCELDEYYIDDELEVLNVNKKRICQFKTFYGQAEPLKFKEF
ncbi:MAG: hypothetical protein COB02_06185 [Candidatus Cloacimonadota bacterium]|nr:MAG: hypothetical protein COB02_06185 [Candidatus Cloacimonadota bacterium]